MAAISQTTLSIAISIKFSLKFVPKDPMNNIPALVQIMAWRRPGDKPLSGPVMVSLLTHICVTRPQWVKGDLNRFSFTRICAHLISLILYYILYCSNMYEWWAWFYTTKDQKANVAYVIISGPSPIQSEKMQRNRCKINNIWVTFWHLFLNKRSTAIAGIECLSAVPVR